MASLTQSIMQTPKLRTQHSFEAVPGSRKMRDEYTLGKTLGSGAFSVVKKAVRKSDGLVVAIKCITRSKLSHGEMKNLEREVKIMREFHHPHVIGLIDAFTDEAETISLVTEFVEGGELFERIQSKTVYSEGEARVVVRLLLSTLEHLHQQGVVHRDLKPENILLRNRHNDTDIVLADFGFAKNVCDLKGDRTLCGTPDYIAPELLQRKPYGPSVDIWSAGVVVYILLGGYPPFYDDDEPKLFKKILSGVFQFDSPFWDSISASAKDLVGLMLTLNPSDRPSASELLKHPWITSQEDGNLNEAVSRLRKWAARRRFKRGVASVMAVNRFKFKKASPHTAAEQTWRRTTFKADMVLVERIGEGKWSSVHICEPKPGREPPYCLKGKLAVKIVEKSRLNAQDREALDAEIALLKGITHPNIIQIHEVYDEKKHIKIVFELLAGGELFDRICARTNYTESSARMIACDLLSSVAYLHSLGILHRDLKPENILLRSEESDTDFVISDFRFACHMEEALRDESLVGTADYVSPEVLNSQHYTPAADVWACGVIIYILLCGYPPFYDEDDEVLYEKIRAGKVEFDPEYWNGISEGPVDMIKSALMKDPKDRPTAEQLLSHPWFRQHNIHDKDSLTPAAAKLKSWQARKNFKGGVNALMALQRMKKALN